MDYDYKLTDTQMRTAIHFAEAYEALSRAGIGILWERDSGTLLLVNAQGVEFTGEIEFDNSFELKGNDIENDNIVYVSDENISDLYNSIYVSPKA